MLVSLMPAVPEEGTGYGVGYLGAFLVALGLSLIYAELFKWHFVVKLEHDPNRNGQRENTDQV